MEIARIKQQHEEGGAPARLVHASGIARPRCLVCCLVAIFATIAAFAAEPALEYKVKAGFLFNFVKFVEWPAGSFSASKSVVMVGVMDDDPAAPVLRQALDGKSVNGRAVEVRLFKEAADARACHLLFLSRAQESRVSGILDQLKGEPVLTVSEIDKFGQRGGMINFVRQEESFRFEVNLEAARRAGLSISSKLASMATIVKDAK